MITNSPRRGTAMPVSAQVRVRLALLVALLALLGTALIVAVQWVVVRIWTSDPNSDRWTDGATVTVISTAPDYLLNFEVLSILPTEMMQTLVLASVATGIVYAAVATLVVLKVARSTLGQVDRIVTVLDEGSLLQLEARVQPKHSRTPVARIGASVDAFHDRLDDSLSTMQHVAATIADEMLVGLDQVAESLDTAPYEVESGESPKIGVLLEAQVKNAKLIARSRALMSLMTLRPESADTPVPDVETIDLVPKLRRAQAAQHRTTAGSGVKVYIGGASVAEASVNRVLADLALRVMMRHGVRCSDPEGDLWFQVRREYESVEISLTHSEARAPYGKSEDPFRVTPDLALIRMIAQRSGGSFALKSQKANSAMLVLSLPATPVGTAVPAVHGAEESKPIE
ncbi:hypothetical protein [Humidisolicoccus flavus]|uniref:hypothetical protein n=1 Tax=Humidisolicoccus flavus TaxID=3111414 RepID=UPI00324364C8